ncbi:hypothetical protein OUZ56_026671 [Daphnia magna]|uniref:DUF4806 domain-containing protein n=1 Tax=Daphnia magna TaxID=35525 RepID=A0ABQ9ZMF3_9CRUS|nr:hypothetical protein OUZ56_026671 [Daphnia magna]
MFFEDKGEFYIVDLHTPEGLQVCVVPDIWCYYVDDKFCCVWPHFHQTKEIRVGLNPRESGPHSMRIREIRLLEATTKLKPKKLLPLKRQIYLLSPKILEGCSEEEGASQLMKNGLPPAPFLLPVAQSTAFSDEGTPGYYSSLPNEENAVSPTQEICSELISAPITSPQSSSEVEDRSMQIHGQVQRKNSGAAGSTYRKRINESTSGYCSSLPNEENAVSPTQEICSQLISSPITSPQSSNEVEDRSMQIHGQVQRMNSGASGSTYTENVVAGSSGTPACGSSGTMGTFNRYVVSQQDFHILRALKQVNATMKEMDRKILSIDKKVEKTATEETTFADIENFPVSFPLANVEEFIKLEDILNEDPSKAAIVYQLVKSCGGMSESDAICRAWIKITSIECRSDCNWKGVKRGTHQKHGLELSSIKDAVLKGIRMNATYADLKDAVFEHETRKFFVRAPEKVRTKLRAKKRPAGTADHPQLPNGVD